MVIAIRCQGFRIRTPVWSERFGFGRATYVVRAIVVAEMQLVWRGLSSACTIALFSVSISMPSLKSREIQCLAHRYLRLTSDAINWPVIRMIIKSAVCSLWDRGPEASQSRSPVFLCFVLLCLSSEFRLGQWSDSSVWFLALLHVVTLPQHR